MKSNLSDKEDHIDIGMVIHLHRTEHKPQRAHSQNLVLLRVQL